MRSVTLNGSYPCISRLARRLRLAVSALALGILLDLPRAQAVDANVKSHDELNTETVASRDREKVWDNAIRYGANTVSNIDRREYAPNGLRAGNYVVLPSIGATVIYDDNIFAIDADKQSDFRFELTPSVEFKSHLPRHILDFSLDGKIVEFAEHTDQNYANYRARVSGALHYDNATTLSASMSSLLKHEERDDPLVSLTAREPVSIFEHRAAIGITHDVGRLYGTLGQIAERRDYSSATSISGETLDGNDRNTDLFTSVAKAGYRFSPGFEVIGKLRMIRTENQAAAPENRSSWGYEAVAGLVFESNPLLRWTILGGYGVRDYDNAKFDSIQTSLLTAEVQWLPTQRLTIYGTLSRQIAEALDAKSTGVVETDAKIKADYEIYHNLVLSGALEYRYDNFFGTSRQDDVFTAHLGVDYYFSKNWLFTFGVDHQVRDSSDDALDMHRNRYMIGAKLRF
jgi:hypothetical protein